MQLKTYPTAAEYLTDNLKWLEQKEVLNSLLLGLALDNAKNQRDGSFYLSIWKDNEIQFSGMQTPGRHLIMSSNDLDQEEFILALADYLDRERITFPGLLGDKNLVLHAGDTLASKLGWKYEVVYKQLVYQLTAVKHNPPTNGYLRKATPEDLELVAKWMHQFLIEALNENDEHAAREGALRKIKNEDVYFWIDEAAMTMTCIARPTNNGITINYVYTPLEHRKKGYATKIVAELSSLMLSRGYQFCTLFTDLENPTSNDIYKRIGYEVVGEFRSIAFVDHYVN